MKANVEWDGYRWIAIAEGGGVTQAKQIEQLPARLVEVVKLMTGDVLAPEDVELVIDFPGADDAAEIRHERAELARREAETFKRLVRIVKELHRRGVSYRDIGVMCGISYQRAHQIADEALVDA
jgi:hypothetical protein